MNRIRAWVEKCERKPGGLSAVFRIVMLKGLPQAQRSSSEASERSLKSAAGGRSLKSLSCSSSGFASEARSPKQRLLWFSQTRGAPMGAHPSAPRLARRQPPATCSLPWQPTRIRQPPRPHPPAGRLRSLSRGMLPGKLSTTRSRELRKGPPLP